MKLNGNLLTPTDPNNWLCDLDTAYQEEGKVYYSGFYRGIRLARIEGYEDKYTEVTEAWKKEHEPKEPEEEEQ